MLDLTITGFEYVLAALVGAGCGVTTVAKSVLCTGGAAAFFAGVGALSSFWAEI